MAKYFVVILVLILSIGGVFVLSNRKSQISDISKISPTGAPTETPLNTLSSLRDLLSSKAPKSCSFTTEMSGFPTEGVVYVSENKMRGDFDSQIEGKATKSHMVIADNVSYIWTEDQNQGIKITFDEGDIVNAEALAAQAKLDINAEMDYDCMDWNPDPSKFTVPEGIQFTAFDDLMNNVPTGTADQCGQCLKLEEMQRTQCLAVLKCSY